MANWFGSEAVKKLLFNKFVVIIGDSVQRGIYKDLVTLLQTNDLMSVQALERKGEQEYMNDALIEGGSNEKMHNGKNYREIRQYQTDYFLVRFYFVTRCYGT